MIKTSRLGDLILVLQSDRWEVRVCSVWLGLRLLKTDSPPYMDLPQEDSCTEMQVPEAQTALAAVQGPEGDSSPFTDMDTTRSPSVVLYIRYKQIVQKVQRPKFLSIGFL
jgi:hypothetical protein